MHDSKIDSTYTTHVARRPKTPHQLIKLLNLLGDFPKGLSSCEIAIALRGSTRPSAYSEELMRARIEATRKQIQRARKYLDRRNDVFCLEYLSKKRVWRLVNRYHAAMLTES